MSNQKLERPRATAAVCRRVVQSNPMFSKSYIGRSGQSWKFWLGFVLLLIGFVLLMSGFTPSMRSAPTLGAVVILTGLGLSAVSFVWTCLSVKCRKCRTRLVWRAMKDQSH